MNTPVLLVSTAALAANTILAQSPASQGLSTDDLFVTPIHTAADDPEGGAYGTWASGRNYKMSFAADGVAFYPVLGDEYPENLPWRWRTESVEAGGQNLVADVAPTVSHTDWRFEIHYGGVTERYDVRPDGVEQSFVVHERPAAGGSIHVTGRIASALATADRAPSHGGIVYHGSAGEPIMTYGAAFAIGADGSQTLMRTAVDGDRVRLELDAESVADAAFPLTIDPLLQSTTVAFGANVVADLDVARDDRADELMTFYVRKSSGSDYDAFARLADDDFGSAVVVFQDITDEWSTRSTNCAFVGGPDRWILVFQRDFPHLSTSWIRFHLRDSGDRSPSSSYVSVPKAAGTTARSPDVGGSDANASGDDALLIYTSDVTTTQSNTLHTEIYTRVIDVRNGTIGSAEPFGGFPVGSSLDRSHPTVNQTSAGGADGWVVACTEFNRSIANDDFDVAVARVETDGSSSPRVYFGTGSSHKIWPRVAGRADRYLLTWGQTPQGGGHFVSSFTPTIRAERFNWFNNSSAPNKRGRDIIRSGGNGERFFNSDLAFDDRFSSHWVSVSVSESWDSYADRIGFDVGVAETRTIYAGQSSSTAPAVTFDNDATRFPIVYGTTANVYPLFGTHMTYPNASVVRSGPGCGGSINTSGNAWSGNEFFSFTLGGAAPNLQAVLMLSTAGAAVPLDSMGMPGCVLGVSTAPGHWIGSATMLTNGGGGARLSIALPSDVSGLVYAQWAHLAPGANALGVELTQTLRVNVQ